MTEPSSGRRPVVFDLTHLVSRLPKRPTSGIDRIDLAYATHFAGERSESPALHYGLRRPHLIAPAEARKLVRLAGSLWDSQDARRGDDGVRAARGWLAASPVSRAPKPSRHPVTTDAAGAITRRLNQYRGRILDDRKLGVPERSIYLNVAQHVFEHPLFFRWLDARDDVCSVFMIHDLLPLDYPEYFSAANLGVFRRRIGTAIRHADAFLVSTRTVRARLEKELQEQGAPLRPIHVQPFPSPLASQTPASPPAGGHPYFLALGTIEPRKNHLMLLHVWRKLIARDPEAPRLVIVGARGWENEQVADILDRSVALGHHVLELSGLPSADLVDLIHGAQALLAPSFDEGYGLPVVEALSLGAPVVISDIPVFREISQGCATFVAPLDGLAWTDAIVRMNGDEAYRATRRAEAARFAAPNWPGYFAAVENFLGSL